MPNAAWPWMDAKLLAIEVGTALLLPESYFGLDKT